MALKMAKLRHETSLLDVNLNAKFKWIKDIHPYWQFIPSADSTYCIRFYQYLHISSYQRKQFEEFLSEFYETKKQRHQFICCWRESGVIITVFKPL